MKKYIYIFFIVGVVISNYKCRKDPDPKPAVTPWVHQDLTDYSYFNVGTYWIYQDSASGVEDSVYVYYQNLSTYYNPGNSIVAAGNYNYYKSYAHSSYDTYDYYYEIDMGYYSSIGSIGVWRIRTKPGDDVGQTFLMSNRFVEGDHIGAYTSDGTTYFKFYADSMNIAGHYFHDVVKFYDSKNPSEYNSPTNFYISKNIGIIRKEKLDTIKTWNLIRYHIEQ